MPTVIALVVVFVAGWLLKGRKIPKVVTKATPTTVVNRWVPMQGDIARNTEFGPIILRVFVLRGSYSGMKGCIIFPEGFEVTEHIIRQLERRIPGYTLSPDGIEGLPNSRRIWATHHTKDERFKDVFGAIKEIMDPTLRPAYD